MNKLIIIGNREIIAKEYNGQRVVTFKDIDMMHGRQEGTAKRNFYQHKDELASGIDFFSLKKADAERFSGTIFSTGLTVLTKTGYLMISGCFLSDFSQKIRQQVLSDYFGDGQNKSQVFDSSPQLQLLFNMEQQQKRQAAELEEVRRQVEEISRRIESVRPTITTITTGWRKEARNTITKIAHNLGCDIERVSKESYELLESRMRVNLQVRLTNKRRRLADDGICKSKRDKLTMIDVIADDKKLIDGYMAIVKEMSIRYGIS